MRIFLFEFEFASSLSTPFLRLSASASSRVCLLVSNTTGTRFVPLRSFPRDILFSLSSLAALMACLYQDLSSRIN